MSPAVEGIGLAFAFASSACNAGAGAAAKAVVQILPSPDGAVAFQCMLSSIVFSCALARQPDAWHQLVEAFSKPGFLVAWAVAGIINIVSTQLYQLGLQKGELGDTLPFLSFTPAILLLFEVVFLQVPTSATGALGTLLISAGGFWLGKTSQKPGPKGSKQQWFVFPPGAGIFTSIAIMWSVSSSFDKRGVRAASPLIYGATMKATIAIGSALVWLSGLAPTRTSKTKKEKFSIGLKHIVLLIAWWALDMSAYWFQLSANPRLPSSYLSGIRRAGCLFGLFLGRLLFEEEIGRKLTPVSVMVLGVCFLAAK